MNRKISLLLMAFLVASHIGFAQDKPEWKTIFANINQEALEHSRAYETLKEATSTIGHRLTGSANGKKAEEYSYVAYSDEMVLPG